MSRIDREQLGEWLTAYIDGELNTEQIELIERLLREDEAVRRLLDELRRTVDLVSSLPRHDAPGSIAEDVQFRVERSDLLGGLEEAGATAGAQRSPILTLISMAAVLGFVVGGLWIMNRREAHQAGSGKGIVALAPEREAEPGPAEPAGSEGVTDSKLLATADFRQKLLAGMGADAVCSHGFDNETVRLQVVVRNEAEGEATAARLLGYLAEHRLADLADVTSGDDLAHAAPAGGFYYRGSPGVNFPEEKQQQILVRASRREFDGLMDELARSKATTQSAALIAGPLSIRGFERIRTALYGLGEPTPQFLSLSGRGGAPSNGPIQADSSSRAGSARHERNASGGARPTGGKLFEDLIKAIRVDPQMLADLAESGSDEVSEMPAVPASVVTDAAGGTAAGKGLVLKEPPSLVERRAKLLDETRRRSIETVGAPRTAGKAVSSKKRGRVHPTGTSTSPAQAGRGIRVDKPDAILPAPPRDLVVAQPAEAYVTLVVQVLVAEPEPPRPPSRARPSAKSRSEQRDDSSPAE